MIRLINYLGTPYDNIVDPSILQEAVLGLLEDAGINTETNDKIMALIEEAEIKVINENKVSVVSLPVNTNSKLFDKLSVLISKSYRNLVYLRFLSSN